jgi:hypothetical protein
VLPSRSPLLPSRTIRLISIDALVEASYVPWFVPEPCGSVALFFYVLPRRIRTGGTLGFWQSSNPDQNLIRLERLWDTLSTIGLACVIIGILLQAASVWIS